MLRRAVIAAVLVLGLAAPGMAHAQRQDPPETVGKAASERQQAARRGVEEGRLAIDIQRGDGSPVETIGLGMMRFRRSIKDYFAICDSYYQAIRASTPQQIETVDMARRGIHNDAAELLMERLGGKITVDFDTARRLFTLICVLHIRG